MAVPGMYKIVGEVATVQDPGSSPEHEQVMRLMHSITED